LGKTDKSKRLNTRLLDFSKTFDYVIDYMISNEIKVFIITGDIFEHRRPKASELGIFAEKIQSEESNCCLSKGSIS
jgi:DNA repair exonuclease SbcCD nuclease subunit